MTFFQLSLKSENREQYALVPIGQRGMNDVCKSLQLEPDEKISMLEISYNGVTIEAGAAMTNKGNFERWGDISEEV